LGEAIKSKPLFEEEIGVIGMEIGHPIAISKGEHVEVATYALPIVKFGQRNEDRNLVNMDVNYGSEDLPMHGNKKGSPCGETKEITNVFKGIVQYSNSREEGGTSDIQMLEVKRAKGSTYAFAHKKLRRDGTKKKKIVN
jgi:hypothetical protein